MCVCASCVFGFFFFFFFLVDGRRFGGWRWKEEAHGGVRILCVCFMPIDVDVDGPCGGYGGEVEEEEVGNETEQGDERGDDGEGVDGTRRGNEEMERGDRGDGYVLVLDPFNLIWSASSSDFWLGGRKSWRLV